MSTIIPHHLAAHADLYAQSPRAASLKWFQEAKYGLFLHFGLYSLLGRGEWVMFHEKIPVAQYAKLKDEFRAEKFDADAITDLALAAGMKYVNLTTRHHDSFSLFETAADDFHSVNSPAKRDLVAELADQCAKKNLGLFLYYSYGADWRHPYFYHDPKCWMARPAYPTPEPTYRYQRDGDMRHFIDFAHQQITELLTNYGPVAGMWFDPIMPYYARPELFPIEETYALIRKLQPHALVAFKTGANGDEDFAAPEREGISLEERVRKMMGDASAEVARKAWERNRDKPKELCDTMQPGKWGYRKEDDGKHHDETKVLAMLGSARAQGHNLLLNTGPLPDGSIDAHDHRVLTAVGAHIRKHGFPSCEAVKPTQSGGAVNKEDAPLA